jgi:hypothetical protein
MQNEGEKSGKEQTTTKAPEKAEAKPLFSRREIRDIVKDFILAWLSGHVKIEFPTCEELLAVAKQSGNKLDYSGARDREVRAKAEFRQCVNICSGAVKATSEEQQKALNEVFDTILALRNGGRISGKFMDFELEQRIHRLEEGLTVTNNFVQEIIEWLYGRRIGS